MSTPVKSEADLEQVALAMMMMAGGEGTSSVAEAEQAEVGVRVTRSSASRSSLQNNRRHQREPVSSNCLNKNKNRKSHGQPGSPEIEGGQEEDSNAFQQSLEESATDLVIKQEEPPDAIICAVNPLSIQSPSPPGSPTGSQRSTNSGSGSAGGNGQAANNDDSAIYMSSSRRVFRPEFKQKVLDAFANDPECVGNQRATARKFGIHRRQVQKWLQQLSTGELSFKDSQQTTAEEGQLQPDNEESDINDLIITTKQVRPSQGNQSTGVTRSTKVTRRGVGNYNNRTALQRNGRASDPPSRPTRSRTRNKGKSMPLKGGSKSTSNFIPSVVQPPSSSSSLLNLSKGSRKQNGGRSSPYAYYNDTNGNGNSTATNGGGSNMFMNMTSLLASAAAAGNLTMPLQLDNPRNFSPRDHSPINGRGSPAHSAGGSSGGSNNSNLQNALLLVDELNYLYPYSDFSLLRKALLKEEVSLEKLANPLIRNKTEFRVNGNNGINSDLSQGARDLRRTAAVSPPAKSSTQQEYNTQQTLDIIRQQQEYFKLLQQCGIGNSPDLPSGLNLTDNGRLPAWFNPFAAAAAAGLPLSSSSGNSNGGKYNGGAVNGNGGENGKRNKDTTSDNHRFASPRVPPAVNSGKAKTVAAALAATRVQSSPQQPAGRNYTNSRGNGRQAQVQRPVHRRKTNASAARSMPQMDDDIDPTSMLEVVTSVPASSNSPHTSASNKYNYNGHHNNHHPSNNISSNDYHQGMDLTTSSAPPLPTTSTATRLVSKAMNKEYAFLNELGLVRKSPEKQPSSSMSNGYGMTHTASLENFVQNILPPRQKSPQAASSSTSSSSPPALDLNDSERTKNMVIDAYMYDPEMAADARAVARKFGLNARVVMKWVKEGLVKSSPQSNEEAENYMGGNDNNNFHSRINGVGYAENEHLQTQNLHKAMLNESNNNSPGSGGSNVGTTVNKRKNSKPNQICDFPEEDDAGFNGALDMVVPIKKRRVSSPSPTPQDS